MSPGCVTNSPPPPHTCIKSCLFITYFVSFLCVADMGVLFYTRENKKLKWINDWRTSRASPDEGSSRYLWNVGKLLPDYSALQPRRQSSSYSLPWEHPILQITNVYVGSRRPYTGNTMSEIRDDFQARFHKDLPRKETTLRRKCKLLEDGSIKDLPKSHCISMTSLQSLSGKDLLN
jgi:hypothetical protein